MNVMFVTKYRVPVTCESVCDLLGTQRLFELLQQAVVTMLSPYMKGLGREKQHLHGLPQ